MRCSHCGICCEKTEMLLSKEDVERLLRKGYKKDRFARCDKKGFVKLRNYGGYCVFYDHERRRCKVYGQRPSGCRLYPVIYDEEKGIVLDEICPMKNTITEREKERKGREVVKLLRRIDEEAKHRVF
jgi:Fe-S-cluster containining protein